MLPFIRSDLSQLTAYTPHQEEASTVDLDHLDTNESPFDLPEALKQKLAWAYQQTIAANRYPDGGHARLKQAIAEYVNESAGLVEIVQAAQITVGNGSDELIRSLLIATCLQGEGSILIAEPTFSMYAILARTLGIPVHSVDRLENFETDVQAAQALIDRTTIDQTTAGQSTIAPPIRVVFVVHPNSPTANALTEAEISWLRSLPDRILVVIDEAYFEFSQTTLVGELLQRPNWVILRTFSKAFRLAAHRVGYAIAHPDLIATLEKVRLPYNLPSFSQAAALTALAHRQQLLPTIPEILDQRTQLLATLSAHPALDVWPSAANFIYLRLRSELVPDRALSELCEHLKAEGTLIRHTGGGLRITVGTAAENARMLDRLQASLDRAL